MPKLSPVPEIYLENIPVLAKEPVPIPGVLDEADLTWSAINALYVVLRQAQSSSHSAISWRNFPVGCAAIATNESHDRFDLVTGYNVKPTAYSGLNIHAEQMLVERARRYSLSRILALAVIGEPQQDTQSGRTAPTLHPCGLCRTHLAESGLMSSSTLIISSVPNFERAELYSFKELVEFHDSDNDRELCGVEPNTVAQTCNLDGSTTGIWQTAPQPFNMTEEALKNRGYEQAVDRLLWYKWAESNPRAFGSAALVNWFRLGQPMAS